MERSWDDLGTAGAALASNKVEVCRLASKLSEVREGSKRSETYRRAAINTDEAVEVREQDKGKGQEDKC